MELEDQLASTRDRITELLSKNRPSTEDISRSMLRAITGRGSYGDELNALRANRIAEQQGLFDVLAGHKKIQQTDRQLGMQEQQNAWDRLQAARKAGIQDAEAIGSAIDRYVVDDAEKQIVANYLQGLPDEVNALNAGNMVAKAVGDLTSSGKIRQRKQSTETGTYSFGNFLPSGSKESFTARKHSKTGRIEYNDGSGWKEAGRGSFIGQNVQAGSTSELTGSDRSKEIKALREAEVHLVNFMKAGSRLLADVERSGDESLGVVGGVSRALDSLGSQLSAATRVMTGGDNTATVSGSTANQIAQNFEWTGTIAEDSAAIRSQIASLAYGLALVKNGERPTDEDVENMMTILAGNAGSGKQLVAATTSAMRDALDSYATRYQVIAGETWDPTETLKRHGITLPGQSKSGGLVHMLNGSEVTPDVISGMSKEQIRELLSDPSLPDEFAPYIQDRMQELGL